MELEKLLDIGDHHYFHEEYDVAKSFYEDASQLGSEVAMYKLGELYEYGQGVNKDIQKAKEYYEKASQLKYAKATYRLAKMNEDGGEFNKKVIELYYKAICQDNELLNSSEKYTSVKTILEEYEKLLTENNKLTEDINKLNKEIELLKTEILYQPGGNGYLQTEQHFNQLINN